MITLCGVARIFPSVIGDALLDGALRIDAPRTRGGES